MDGNNMNQSNGYTDPNANVNAAPTQNPYTDTAANSYTAPTQDAYTAPADYSYSSPVQNTYTDSAAGSYTTPTPNEYGSASTEYSYAADSYAEVPSGDGKNAMALWGMICGIASVICCWNIVGLAAGVVGLVLSLKGKKKIPQKKGMTLTGMITSIAGIVFYVLVFIIALVCAMLGVLSETM